MVIKCHIPRLFWTYSHQDKHVSKSLSLNIYLSGKLCSLQSWDPQEPTSPYRSAEGQPTLTPHYLHGSVDSVSTYDPAASNCVIFKMTFYLGGCFHSVFRIKAHTQLLLVTNS